MPQNLIGCVNLYHSLKGFSKPYLVVPSLGLGYCIMNLDSILAMLVKREYIDWHWSLASLLDNEYPNMLVLLLK